MSLIKCEDAIEMRSKVLVFEEPKLKDPVLIEGLPGIGFIASICVRYLITELRARKFAEIHSPNFQSLAISTEGGGLQVPLNELFYANYQGRDFILLYGNTQSLTAYGQYELCETILDLVHRLGCNMVICIGGIRRRPSTPPAVFCTATDRETLRMVLNEGVSITSGRIAGVAGVLLGLAMLKGMRGFCLLAETTGLYPDPVASEAVLNVLSKIQKIKVDLSKIKRAADSVKALLRISQ